MVSSRPLHRPHRVRIHACTANASQALHTRNVLFALLPGLRAEMNQLVRMMGVHFFSEEAAEALQPVMTGPPLQG